LQKKSEQKKVVEQGVNVWSYKDVKLQSQQLKEINESSERNFPVVNDYTLLVSSDGADNEWNWNATSFKKVYLVSLKDGKKTIINNAVKGPFSLTDFYTFSPGGKFVVYYDAAKRNYFSYEIATGVKRNLTSSIKTTWTTYIKRDVPMAPYMPIGYAGAIENSESILVYDQYDLFQLDPLGKLNPINLTNGYGQLKNIELRCALDKKLFQRNEAIILSGFNRVTKDEGFYKMRLNERTDPELLSSGPYIYKGTWEADEGYVASPVKAKDAEIYVVRRVCAEESENYFWTTDFKTFNRITDIHPEKEFNWLTTELITWKLPDGFSSQGVLYKPENFDPSKKYPVIFYYYENSTEALHYFISPECTRGPLNIPYYVSNGYLVFTPDMHYKIGHPGQSVVNTVVSAANYLSKLPYVDSKHMGLQGHSRGGWETDFIVTHTTIFAAAMASSALTDYVSLYNGVRLLANGMGRQGSFEKGYQRIGGTLWEYPNLFIENSPVFFADKVATPLLMMANKEDNDIAFEQGVEFFSALRRLGKRAWMLQYDGQGHLANSKKASEDLEIRMKQFFDHYLKDSACPRWMLYGVPATEKGNPDALQLVYEKDNNGKWLTPKEGGLLTDEERKKVDALRKRKPVTATFE
jgi:dienelactone hydrolase